MMQVDPLLPLPEQLKALRLASCRTILEQAERTGLSRLTVSDAEGRRDAKLSSISALFDALGYTLVPVPKNMVAEVASFINNGGVAVSLPAGTSAPLGVGQRSFLADDTEER